MSETQYNAEADLQELLEKHPDLLAGDQMRANAPRRWVLIAREAGIPDAAGAQDRWAIDHLFVDQDAIPTLVEVKRSSDTRLRREVVGQILDYAANGVAYWPAGAIRTMYEDTCRANGKDADGELARLLTGIQTSVRMDAGESEQFWDSVAQNLTARRLRLVIVADVIPPELQRIVEFLNEGMARTEVLAVEVKQFASADGRTTTLVPRVIGQTSAADDAKRSSGSRPSRDWDEPSFLASLSDPERPAAAEVARDLVNWMHRHGTGPTFGHGMTGPMYVHIPLPGGGGIRPFDLSASDSGRLEVLFNGLATTPPFDQPSVRHALKDRLNAIPGVSISDVTVDRANWTSFAVARIAEPGSRRILFDSLDWIVAELARSEPAPTENPTARTRDEA